MLAKALILGLLSATGALTMSPDASAEAPLEARSYKPVLGSGSTLKIMALGDATTWGSGSDKTGGWRQSLVKKLTDGKNKVKMIGTRQNGDFDQKDNEGWPNTRVEELAGKWKEAAKKLGSKNKPGLVLLNVGTENAVKDKDVDNASKHLESLVKDILKKWPKSAVIVGTLIHSRKEDVEKRVQKMNKKYEEVVNKLIKDKKRVIFVDMAGKDSPQTKDGDYSDDNTLNDKGYEKMANLWYNAIKEADRTERNLLRPSKIRQILGKPKDLVKKPKDALNRNKSKLLEDIRKIVQEELKKFENTIKDLKKKN